MPQPSAAGTEGVPREDAEFTSEFERGLQAERDGQLARAGEHYERALARAEQSSVPSPRLRSLLALGWIHYRLQAPLRSVEYLKRAVADAALPEDRARDARALIDLQMKQLGHLRIDVRPPPGDETRVIVEVDRSKVADPADVPVTVGRHEVRANAQGFEELVQTIDVGMGKSEQVSGMLVRREPSNGLRQAAWIVGGVAALSLAVGVGSGIFSWVKHDASECDPARCTDQDTATRQTARTAGDVSTWTFVGAGVGAAVSAYLFWQAGSRESTQTLGASTRVSLGLTSVHFVQRW